jgi:hypothetical protein
MIVVVFYIIVFHGFALRHYMGVHSSCLVVTAWITNSGRIDRAELKNPPVTCIRQTKSTLYIYGIEIFPVCPKHPT